MSHSPVSAKAEWTASWRVVLAAALGYSVSGLHIYPLGVFIAPIQEAFGWSRAQTLSGTAIVSFAVALAAVPTGILLDRFGARRIALAGVILIALAVALLGTATGSLTNWWMLWLLVALCASPVQATVWTSAVAKRFDTSRGFALAVTLNGAALGALCLPLLATVLIERFGWQPAFGLMAMIWVGTLLPVLFFFFRTDAGTRGAQPPGALPPQAQPGLTLGQALRQPAFYKLYAACGLFILVVMGAMVNFVPILTDRGVTPLAAAGAASLIGVFSIIGRLATGMVLDRFPARLVAAVAFILPLPACLLLLSPQSGPAGGMAAAAFLGLALGAEIDVVTYLATRRFGLKHFGAIQGALLSAIALGSAIGPVAAGASFDVFGAYGPFLTVAGVVMVASSLLVSSIRDHLPAPDPRAP